MIGKILFFVSAVAASLLGLPAGAATTSQGVDVVVTHGAPPPGVLTTFTFVNDSKSTLPAGSPVSFGQGFRYGDIMPGTYPLIRDAVTHAALSGQQWDEIDTWLENGGNHSWRHAVWAAWLPHDLAPGATQQFEFVPTAGTYAETSHQPLSALCGGPAAHDLKIHLTHVANQDYTVRDSGDATFRVCDNIANVGRDAPRHLRAGNVYDEYVVNGLFAYTSGHKDPLLYVQCYVDIFTKASDGVSPGDVRWVCEPSNSWENVAAGSTGNAGNPGPAGFANDPQAIIYRVEIDDGSSKILDWSGLDATIASSSNPIAPTSNGICDTNTGSFCMKVPSSTGANAWYSGQPAWVTCTGTCVAGATPNTLVYMLTSSASRSAGADTTWVSMATSPLNIIVSDPGLFMTGSQGTGTTTFSNRFEHYKFETWQTLDASGQDNWAPLGTTTRVTRKIYPAFTSAEKTYWEQTGLIVPMVLNQSPTVDINWEAGLGSNYAPFGKGPIEGGTGVGARADLGIVNEFAAQAFVTGAQQDWDTARAYTLGSSIHGFSTLINEATGYIPVLNNGPPEGPGHNGQGGSYGVLGAPHNQDYWGSLPTQGITEIDHTPAPPATIDPSGGTYNFGTYISHMPSFNGVTYAVFGDHYMLDLIYWNANRDFLQQRTGTGDPGQGYLRDNIAVFTDGNTYHYWGLMIDCCETRGAAWMRRDVTDGATYGVDGSPERQMFGDFLGENAIYYPLWLKYIDGPSSTPTFNYTNSISAPDWPGAPGSEESSIFIMSYVAAVDYNLVVKQHSPYGAIMSRIDQRRMEATMGGRSPGALPPYYNVYYYNPLAVHDGDCNLYQASGKSPDVGHCFNGTDATDFWLIDGNAVFSAGGLVTNIYHDMSAGGTAKNLGGWDQDLLIDQMPGIKTFNVIGPYSADGLSFHIQCNSADHAAFPVQCPVAGGPFVDLTSGGVSIAGNGSASFGVRPLLDPGPGTGFTNGGYSPYAYQNIVLLKVSGYNVDASLNRFLTQAGGVPCNPIAPSQCVDPNLVVPGLPPAVNGLP